jgi:phosphatidylglycerophosphatase A
MRNRLSLAYASFFHIGFIPGAPGTYGSLATTILFALTYLIAGRIDPVYHLIAAVLVSFLGVLASTNVSRTSGIEDPQYIVIDEVAGQLLTFLFLPVTATNLILGTILFRIFDIWKPFPVRQLESLKGGVGIMADDLMAGVYGNLILQLIAYFMKAR